MLKKVTFKNLPYEVVDSGSDLVVECANIVSEIT